MTQVDDNPVAGEETQQAADRAVDPDALLDGEDPTSVHPDDIDHWIHAYSELVEFKQGLLAGAREQIVQMDNPNARREADDVDVTILTAELDRYRRRLRFWQQRWDMLHDPRG